MSDFDPWAHFKKLDRLGESKDEIVNEYGSKLERLGDIIYDGYSDSLMEYRVTEVGGEIYNVSGTKIAYAFFYDEDYCDIMSGTAKELFDLNSDIDIGALMSKLDVQIGDKKTYSIVLPLDVSKCCWWSIVADDIVSVNGIEYGYLVRVYPKGLESVYYKYDVTDMPDVVELNDIQKYYGGVTDEAYIVNPDTRVTISLIKSGIGLF